MEECRIRAEAFFKEKEERKKAEELIKTQLAAEEAAASKAWTDTPEAERDVAVLFPGQGTQKVGMAGKLLESPAVQGLFELSSKVLGYDMVGLCAQGPQEKLDTTLYSQPAVFVCSLAAMEKAKKEAPDMLKKVKCAAGFSLGEYSALVFGGALSFEDGLRVVKARAEAMDVCHAGLQPPTGRTQTALLLTRSTPLEQAAAKAAPGGMATVTGASDAALQQALDKAAATVGGGKKAYIANYMFPEGRTCSGDREVLKRLCEKVTAMGSGKSGKLVAVSGAFHTPYMASAVPKLAAKLDATEIKLPTIGILSNVTGAYYQSAEQIKELLKRQIVEPVRWEQTMEVACKGTYGVAGYIESGPGKQLRAMMRRIDADCWGKMVVLE